MKKVNDDDDYDDDDDDDENFSIMQCWTIGFNFLHVLAPETSEPGYYRALRPGPSMPYIRLSTMLNHSAACEFDVHHSAALSKVDWGQGRRNVPESAWHGSRTIHGRHKETSPKPLPADDEVWGTSPVGVWIRAFSPYKVLGNFPTSPLVTASTSQMRRNGFYIAGANSV